MKTALSRKAKAALRQENCRRILKIAAYFCTPKNESLLRDAACIGNEADFDQAADALCEAMLLVCSCGTEIRRSYVIAELGLPAALDLLKETPLAEAERTDLLSTFELKPFERLHFAFVDDLIERSRGKRTDLAIHADDESWRKFGYEKGIGWLKLSSVLPVVRDALEEMPKPFFLGAWQNLRKHIELNYDPDLMRAMPSLLSERLADDPDANDWFCFYQTFLLTGQPAHCAAQIKGDTVAGEVMLGAAALYRNDPPETALGHLKKALSLAGRRLIFRETVKDWFYLAALHRDRSNPASLKKLTAIANFKSIDGFEHWRSFSNWIWLIAAQGSALDFKAEALRRLETAKRYRHSCMDEELFFALLARFGLFPAFTDAYIAALGRSSPVFAAEFDDLLPKQSPLKIDPAAFGLSPLLSVVGAKEAWEAALDELQPNEKDAGTLAFRIAYQLDVRKEEIRILQQSSTDGFNWTPGKTISPAEFMKGVAGMTAQDKKAAEVFRTLHYSKRGELWQNVLETLVGAMNVFNAKIPALRMDIIKEPLHVAVMKENDGYRITSNLSAQFDIVHDGLSVEANGIESLVLVRPTLEERRFLAAASRVKVFPPKAAPMLSGVLEDLSRRTPVFSDLLEDQSSCGPIEGDSRITFRISPIENTLFFVSALVKPDPLSFLCFDPGRGSRMVFTTAEGKLAPVLRNLSAERAHYQTIADAVPAIKARRHDFTWILPMTDALVLLNALRKNASIVLVEWPQGEELAFTASEVPVQSLRLSVRRIGEWFTVEGSVRIDDKAVLSIDRLLEAIEEARDGFVRLNEKTVAALSSGLRTALECLEKLAVKDKSGGGLKVSIFNALQIEALREAGVRVEADDAYQAFVERMKAAQDHEPPVPAALKATLRSYQAAGFKWLSRLAHWGAGALLADDMGLGKTVQAIALLLERSQTGPALVVAPASVLFNWLAELKRFAPTLKPLVFNAGSREERGRIARDAAEGDVVLATYGVLVTECEKLAEREWGTLILDEAQMIKNARTKQSGTAKLLRSKARVLLTGTPIENHLSEFWNLFDTANPGLLGTFRDFTHRFIGPIELAANKDQQRLLKRLISPFVLRRKKSEVLDELPKKTELTIQVELSPKEAALYENIRKTTVARLEGNLIGPLQALAALTRLRLAACHMKLVLPEARLPSAKTEAFLRLVDDLTAGGHRALVFSQFTSHLALIRESLAQKGVKYLYLDGAVPAAERKALADRFQTSDIPLFLISLKAGGTGLNLTAADFVIHLDPWWNPAVEEQASNRAYRIGQEKPVTIYRLVSKNTVEEKILQLHETKKELADALLEGTNASSRLTREEILELLAAK